MNRFCEIHFLIQLVERTKNNRQWHYNLQVNITCLAHRKWCHNVSIGLLEFKLKPNSQRYKLLWRYSLKLIKVFWMCQYQLVFLMQILYQNEKKIWLIEQVIRWIAIKTHIFLFVYLSPASVHEIRHVRSSATLPTSFRISSVGDIFVNKLWVSAKGITLGLG